MAKEAIYEKAKDSIIEADEDMAMEALEEAEAEGLDLVELLTQGYSAGMKELGDQFGMGEIFLPELIFATEVMKTVSEEIEGKMDMSQVQQKGTLVIGTVEGDVHDIGKGIVASLVKTNGVKVVDLGREVPAQNFVDAAIENNAEFVGSSALLTTTMTVQKDIEEALKEAGIRVEADYNDINMRDKIKRFKNMKDPYILVLGGEEAASEEVSVNVRGSNQQVRNVPLSKFIETCKKLNADRTLDLPSEF